MTSKQVLLLTAAIAMISGCTLFWDRQGMSLESPYPTRRVWAVAPLRNESGSVEADGWSMADHLTRHLENATNLDVLPVNRVLATMEKLRIAQVTNADQAQQLLHSLRIDGLVVGTITAYDPYDPPKLGLAIELYANKKVEYHDAINVRQLSRAATAVGSLPEQPDLRQPVSTVSAVFDAAHQDVQEKLKRYATGRGRPPDRGSWYRYRISMDLYSEFVSYVMSWRLLWSETQRIAPVTNQPAPS